MQQSASTAKSKPIQAAICLDAGVYHRYRAVLRHLCVGLIDEVAGVRLITSAADAQALSLGPVRVTLYEELRWPFAARRMRQLLDRIRNAPPSVVHAMSAGSYAVAEAVAAEFECDLIYQITALEDVDACAKSSHKGPRRIICASEPLFKRYVSATGTAPEKVNLIRPGVTCAAEPTCFGKESREVTVLSTADLRAGSGVDRLIEAVNQLRQRDRKFLTFLLGSGPEEPRLRQLCNQLGLSGCIVFAQPSGTALKAMEGADIFVQPGEERAISARSLQALAQGMAVVGVAGGVHDAYIPDKTALIIERSDTPQLVQAIEQLLSDHALARRLATGAIAHMRAYHTMTAMAEQTGAIYRDMALQRATFPMRP